MAKIEILWKFEEFITVKFPIAKDYLFYKGFLTITNKKLKMLVWNCNVLIVIMLWKILWKKKYLSLAIVYPKFMVRCSNILINMG